MKAIARSCILCFLQYDKFISKTPELKYLAPKGSPNSLANDSTLSSTAANA